MGREKAERARRFCDADEEWFAQAVAQYSALMSRMVTKHLQDYHNRTVPDVDEAVTELTPRERRRQEVVAEVIANVDDPGV